MDSRLLLVFAAVAALLVVEINATCLCKQQGINPCTCKTQYVQPAPRPKILAKTHTVCKQIGVQKLEPVGDTCDCGKTHVKPGAITPTCSGSSDCGCAKCKLGKTLGLPQISHLSHPQPLSKAPFQHEPIRAPEQYQSNDQSPGILSIITPSKSNVDYPVDAVSLGIALDQAERCQVSVPEWQLQYGYRGQLRDAQERVEIPELREEEIYALKREPVELSKCSKHAEPIEEVYEEDEDSGYDFATVGNLGFQEIGYKFSRIPEPAFIRQQYQAPPPKACDDNEYQIVQRSQRSPSPILEALSAGNKHYDSEGSDLYEDSSSVFGSV